MQKTQQIAVAQSAEILEVLIASSSDLTKTDQVDSQQIDKSSEAAEQVCDVMPLESRVSSFNDGLPSKDQILNEDLVVLNNQKDWPFCVGQNHKTNNFNNKGRKRSILKNAPYKRPKLEIKLRESPTLEVQDTGDIQKLLDEDTPSESSADEHLQGDLLQQAMITINQESKKIEENKLDEIVNSHVCNEEEPIVAKDQDQFTNQLQGLVNQHQSDPIQSEQELITQEPKVESKEVEKEAIPEIEQSFQQPQEPVQYQGMKLSEITMPGIKSYAPEYTLPENQKQKPGPKPGTKPQYLPEEELPIFTNDAKLQQLIANGMEKKAFNRRRYLEIMNDPVKSGQKRQREKEFRQKQAQSFIENPTIHAQFLQKEHLYQKRRTLAKQQRCLKAYGVEFGEDSVIE